MVGEGHDYEGASKHARLGEVDRGFVARIHLRFCARGGCAEHRSASRWAALAAAERTGCIQTRLGRIRPRTNDYVPND